MIWPLRVLFAGSMVTLAIVLTALSGGKLESATGYDGAARAVILSDWWTLWAVPPVEFALIVLLALTLRSSIRRAEQGRRSGIRQHVAHQTAAAPTWVKPNGLPSESRHTAHRSPGWMTCPPNSATRVSA